MNYEALDLQNRVLMLPECQKLYFYDFLTFFMCFFSVQSVVDGYFLCRRIIVQGHGSLRGEELNLLDCTAFDGRMYGCFQICISIYYHFLRTTLLIL